MHQTITPKKGSILVSKPLIADGFFEQSVVYLTAHDSDGSLGFTLNKPSSLLAQDFIEDLPGKDTVYFGGPVEQDALFFLHRQNDLQGAIHVGNSLYLGGDFDQFIKEYKNVRPEYSNSQTAKFFLGYSGWSPGQLEDEIKDDTWIVLDPPKGLNPLDASGNTWREYMVQLGGKYALWANAPEDPLLN